MKHTPGPWKWGDGWEREHNFEEGSGTCDKYMDMRLWGADGSEIIPIRIDHYEPEWDCPYDCETPNKADRDLIVAAPDLLEACKALKSIIDNCEPYSEEAINQAGVAIKKAEGEM